MPTYNDVKPDPAGKGWHGYKAVTNPDGTRTVLHRRGPTAKVASDRLRQAVEKHQREGRPTDPTAMSFAEYVDWWLRLNRPEVAHATHYGDYRYKLGNFCRIIGNVKMSKLGAADLERARQFLATRARVKGVGPDDEPIGFPPSTVHAHFRSLKVMLNDAVRRGHIAVNAASSMTIKKGGRPERRMFQRQEAVQLLKYTSGSPTWEARIAIHLTIGARQGEVLGLQWAYVDWEHCLLTISHSVERRMWEHGCADETLCGTDLKKLMRARRCPARRGGGLFLKETKGKRRRTVMLSPEVVHLLKEHQARQQVEHERAGQLWQDNDLIFPMPDGRIVDKASDQRAWGRLLAAAGVAHKGTHAARRFFATYALRDGSTIHAVSETLGHHRDSFTHDTYVGDVADGQHGLAATGSRLLRDARPRRLRSVG